MFKSSVLEAKESKAVIGGGYKQGPYGECIFMYNEWYRVDKNSSTKGGMRKRCNEK